MATDGGQHYSKLHITYNLLNTFTGSPSWNRQHHGQTIHPTENEFVQNFLCCDIGMNIFYLHGYGGQKCHSECTLWHSMFGSSHSASSAYQRRTIVAAKYFYLTKNYANSVPFWQSPSHHDAENYN